MTRATKMLVIAMFGLTGALLAQAASAATGTFTAGTFTAASDIDLSGNLGVVAAENEFGAAVTLGSVNFSAGTPDGTTNASAYFKNPSSAQYGGFNYGSSTYPAGLKTLMDPVIYNTFIGPVVDLMDGKVAVTAGKTYKLQLLFSDQTTGAWDPWTITVEGDTYTNFNVFSYTGVQGPATGKGADISYTYTALDSELDIRIASQGGAGIDGVFLNAFLVTELPEPASLSLLAIGSLAVLRRSKRARVV